jgi:hypothetical protein
MTEQQVLVRVFSDPIAGGEPELEFEYEVPSYQIPNIDDKIFTAEGEYRVLDRTMSIEPGGYVEVFVDMA